MNTNNIIYYSIFFIIFFVFILSVIKYFYIQIKKYKKNNQYNLLDSMLENNINIIDYQRFDSLLENMQNALKVFVSIKSLLPLPYYQTSYEKILMYFLFLYNKKEQQQDDIINYYLPNRFTYIYTLCYNLLVYLYKQYKSNYEFSIFDLKLIEEVSNYISTIQGNVDISNKMKKII
jgi:hypothetical protein